MSLKFLYTNTSQSVLENDANNNNKDIPAGFSGHWWKLIYTSPCPLSTHMMLTHVSVPAYKIGKWSTKSPVVDVSPKFN